MKVLHIIPSMDSTSGGTSQAIRNIAPEMLALGVENEVLSMDAPDSEFLITDPFTTYAIGQSKGPWAHNAGFVPWLEENLSQYDAVIIHGMWLYHSYAATKVIRKLRRNTASAPRLYLMPHGMLDPWFQKAKGRRLKAIRNWFYWKLIEKDVVSEPDAVLFTCEEELTLARTTFFPYKPKKELNASFGIQTPPERTGAMSESLNALLPTLQNKPYLLFLSRIHVKKGVDLLISAYKELKKRRQHLPALVIAGPGLETAYGKEMIGLADGDPDIVFTGMISGDTKWGALYHCEAFVLPSHQENFGIAVVEALACEKPVLISNKINIWKEIGAGNGGIIANDTLEGTITILEKWVDLSAENKAEMSRSAQKTFLDNFSIRSATVKLIDCISQ